MSESQAKWSPRILARSARIVSGLVLLAFVTTHLLNASLGLISLDAMDAAEGFLTGIWGGLPLGPVLMLSFFAHFFLGLWSIYQRPTLRTNSEDMMQLITAVLVVPLMATHVLGIYLSNDFGFVADYAGIIRLMWIDQPSLGLLQVVVVSVVWVHGAAGLLIWMRSMEKARNLILWVYPIVIIIPVLSLLGFSEAGRQALEQPMPQVAVETTDAVVEEERPAAPQRTREEVMEIITYIKDVTNWTIWGSLGLAAMTLIARWLRIRLGPNRAVLLVRDGASLEPFRSGLTVFDALQSQNEPHAGLCQGRGRCGTCAVRVLSSEFPLPGPTELEQQTLLKRGLEPGARLACQLKPDGGQLVVEALYPADYTFHSLDDQQTEPESDEVVEAAT